MPHVYARLGEWPLFVSPILNALKRCCSSCYQPPRFVLPTMAVDGTNCHGWSHQAWQLEQPSTLLAFGKQRAWLVSFLPKKKAGKLIFFGIRYGR